MRSISEVKVAGSFWQRLLWNRVLWILVVGLLAMSGALKADFYMDDYGFILNRNGDAPQTFTLHFAGHAYGSMSPDAREVTIFQLLPTLLSAVTNWLFPMNAAAAHIWNLLIHLTLAVAIYRAGQRLLRRLQLLPDPESCRRAALAAALLFACHPLATEPVHYAKCHMVALVALFGFFATCEAFEFLNRPSRRRALRLFLFVGLGMISYFPGTVLLGFNLAVLLVYSFTGPRRVPWKHYFPSKSTLRRPPVILAILAAAAATFFAGFYFLPRFNASLSLWDGYFSQHIVTQGRVFWDYVQRIIFPVGLSSDHYQPWSTFHDPMAVVRLILLGMLLIGSATVAWRRRFSPRRGLGMLLLLAIIPLAMRLLYVNSELMVEYRAYSVLPWACLLAGCGFQALAASFARRSMPRLAWVPAAALIACFVLFSASRGRVWQSSIELAADALAQYPLNNRARNQLQYYDFHAGRYAAVLERHEEVLAAVRTMVALNAKNEGKVLIDGFRANANIISSFQLAIYARAELEGRLKALAFADQSIASLKGTHPAWFQIVANNPKTSMWPILEARAAVDKMAVASP